MFWLISDLSAPLMLGLVESISPVSRRCVNKDLFKVLAEREGKVYLGGPLF